MKERAGEGRRGRRVKESEGEGRLQRLQPYQKLKRLYRWRWGELKPSGHPITMVDMMHATKIV